jgi:hypothetical protein
MRYSVEVYNTCDLGDVLDTTYTDLKLREAIKTAKVKANADTDKHIYITWYRASDGQKGFYNPSGDHELNGQSWQPDKNEFYYNLKSADLKGTEKQITWAESIRLDLIEQINNDTIPQIQHLFTKDTDKIKKFITKLKKLQTTNSNLNNQFVIHQVKQLIADEANATTFIDNQSLLSFLSKILK